MLVACLVFASDAMAASRKKVAVYVEGDVTPSERQIVSASVIARLSSSDDYVAFERNDRFTKALDKEQDCQVAGDVPVAEIRAVGKRQGVDYVIVVSVTDIDRSSLHMTARLINLETAQILKSVDLSRDYTEKAPLKEMANNVSYRLVDDRSK